MNTCDTFKEDLFKHYHVMIVGASIEEPCEEYLCLVLVARHNHSETEAYNIAAEIADENRDYICQGNTYAIDNQIDWSAYADLLATDYDDSLHYDIWYDKAMEMSDAWVQEIPSWQDLRAAIEDDKYYEFVVVSNDYSVGDPIYRERLRAAIMNHLKEN